MTPQQLEVLRLRLAAEATSVHVLLLAGSIAAGIPPEGRATARRDYAEACARIRALMAGLRFAGVHPAESALVADVLAEEFSIALSRVELGLAGGGRAEIARMVALWTSGFNATDGTSPRAG